MKWIFSVRSISFYFINLTEITKETRTDSVRGPDVTISDNSLLQMEKGSRDGYHEERYPRKVLSLYGCHTDQLLLQNRSGSQLDSLVK